MAKARPGACEEAQTAPVDRKGVTWISRQVAKVDKVAPTMIKFSRIADTK
jgi:hypothetical protein